ncbi:hypothetical protein BKA70DRAFT_1446257 [Coprinopsis sp. MPI-PUGE-AT-0042]|nr:hypothetical protein BKA70DRAFT_1446257 [Coprinopsis sp. MPI-PUGE-AT-0042]
MPEQFSICYKSQDSFEFNLSDLAHSGQRRVRMPSPWGSGEITYQTGNHSECAGSSSSASEQATQPLQQRPDAKTENTDGTHDGETDTVVVADLPSGVNSSISDAPLEDLTKTSANSTEKP